MKRQLPKRKQLRNIAYLCFIAMVLLAACVMDRWYMWGLFAATAYEFWPQGHYGKRGVQ